MFRITSQKDVVRFVVGLNLFTLSFATPVLLVLYPREEWLWEISVSWPIVIFLSTTAGTFTGRQMLRVHQLNEELTRLVSRDRLTNVATRDHFFDRMSEMGDAAGVTLMIDIDHFKRINDTYGHMVGDTVIAQVAQSLERATRPGDLVCRFGGEEFVMFLIRVEEDNAQRVANRLCETIKSAPVVDGDVAVDVTVSVGGAVRQPGEDIDATIQRADNALYQAKQSGRDRAIMASIGNDTKPDLPKTA